MRACAVRSYMSLGLVLALAGCASSRHREALYEAAHQHVYAQPIEQVWPQVVKLVSSEGYGHRKSDREFILVTEWRNDMQDSRVVSSASRLYAEGFRVDDGSSTVRIFRQTLFTGNKGEMSARGNAFTDSLMVGAAGDVSPLADDPVKMSQFMDVSADHTPLTRAPAELTRSMGRDGELEWKLLRLVDAAQAEAIEARISAEAKK